MNQITYHYAEPEEILKLDDETFERLMCSNIYRINSKFALNDQCMNRLLAFTKNMEASSKNLKIVKDLMRTFQSSILFFLKDFYTNSDANFMNVLSTDASDTQKTAKKKSKCLNLLKEISLLYKKITEKVGKIEVFEFFNKYGTSQKQMNFTRSNAELQHGYLWFLKRCFQVQIKMKDPNIPAKSKLQSLEVLQNEFGTLFNDQEPYYLEKLTFKKICEKFTSLMDSTKQTENSLQKSKIPQSTIRKEKKKHASINSHDLEAVRNISPCCRTFFYQNEPIYQAESFSLEYKNYQSPYDKFCVTNLKRAICGFLNRDGGIILVGIMEGEDKYKEVRGQYLSENEKEEVIKEYRSICTQIYPNIVGQTKYAVKFVPIKKSKQDFVAGKYIVRVEVAAGNQRSLYTYKDIKEEFVALRTANEVLKREINQQMLVVFKQRLLNPKEAQPIHEKPCPEPQIGEPTWENRSIYNKNWNNYQNRTKKRNKQDRSGQKSSDDSKKGKKITWTEKFQNVRFSRKDKKPGDFAYFSEKPIETNELVDEETKYRYKFICDDDDEENVKKESDEQKLEEVKQIQKNDEELDFRPLNPMPYRKKPVPIPKKPTQYIVRQEVPEIEEPNQIRQVPYRLERVSTQREEGQRPISETQGLDLLIVGFPFDKTKDLISNYDLKLVDEPVQCNDFITWVKLELSVISDNYDKYLLFSKALLRNHQQLNIEKKLAQRKLYPNLVFQNEILLNKLIHKYKHDQEFTDRDGCIYYSLKNNIEAIQAYMIGWEMNIKVKFVSNADLKQKKLAYLKFKVQGQL